MKIAYKLFLLTFFSFFLLESSNACSPYGVPILSNQTVNGTNLELSWISTTAWACSYNIVTELYCTASASGAPLVTNQSGCINKPNTSNIAYPSIQTLDLSGLCPGETYFFRAKETSCGSSLGGSGWTSFFSFVYGSAGAFQVTASASSLNICLGSCATLTGVGINNCQPGINYTWDNGAGTGSVVNVCPTTTTTYTVTATTTGVCATLTATSSLTIVVDLPPIAGTAVAAPDHVCVGDVTNLTLTGYNGNLQWQSSSSIAGPWVNEVGATASTYTTPPINSITYYQVEVSNACGSVFSNVITVYPEPYPSINFSMNDECLYDVVNFTNNTTIASGNIISWAWNFGNSNTSALQNPASESYPTEGTYNVSLTVTSDYNCVSNLVLPVIIHPVPVAAFTFTNECFGSATNFIDNSTVTTGTITQWDWDFQNNGTVDNTAQNPTNGYPSAGTYTAELLVTTALGCVDSTTMQVVVDPVPVASFTASNECLGTATTIVNNSSVLTGAIIGWEWDYGDALGTSIIQNPAAYTYASSGNYTITLTVTSDSGCTNTTTVNIDVYNMPTAAFTVNNECLNVAASFADNSNGNGGVITNWDWDFDGNGTTDDINQNPTNLFPSDGIYNVELIVSTGFGCADTIIQPIEIYPMPVANFSFINACYGTLIAFTDLSTVSSTNTPNNIAAWNWNFGNSNTSIVQSPAENYASEGIYNVELIVTTNNGCRGTLTQNIEVWPIPVVDFTPTEVCLNAISQFNDLTTVSNLNTPNTIVQWSWDFGDGVGLSGNQNPVYGYTVDGIYPANLSVVSNNGCTHDTTINVTVNPLPQVIFGDPTSGCAPNMCVTFVNNTTINTAFQPTASISAWSWDFGDGDMSLSMSPTKCYQNSSYSVLDNFDVTLTAISDKQCTTTVVAPSMITVYPKPLADFSYTPDNADIYDTEIIFTDNSIIASIWNWDFGDGTTSNANNPVHEYPDSGSYDVVFYMENIYGCKDTARRTVVIDPVFAIWIPNVFTPDGDGINDLFFSKGFGILELQTLIFDRWGELLFEGYALNSQWGGYYKGVEVQEDVYVYKIRARDVFNEWHEFIGRVTLIK
jgi:gliding motility-associated-like protein